MAEKIRLQDRECPLSATLGLVGEWWTLLILHDAFDGYTRFDQFQESLGISSSMLTTRLRTLVADGLHARTDGFTSLAVLLGAGGVALGFPLADPIVGLFITIAILAVLRTAARDVFRRLMDGVDPELVDAAEAALAAQPGVTGVRSVKMRWIGHRIHADAELDVDPATSLSDAHRLAHDAEHALTHAVPKLSTALVHAYPASHPAP